MNKLYKFFFTKWHIHNKTLLKTFASVDNRLCQVVIADLFRSKEVTVGDIFHSVQCNWCKGNFSRLFSASVQLFDLNTNECSFTSYGGNTRQESCNFKLQNASFWIKCGCYVETVIATIVKRIYILMENVCTSCNFLSITDSCCFIGLFVGEQTKCQTPSIFT